VNLQIPLGIEPKFPHDNPSVSPLNPATMILVKVVPEISPIPGIWEVEPPEAIITTRTGSVDSEEVTENGNPVNRNKPPGEGAVPRSVISISKLAVTKLPIFVHRFVPAVTVYVGATV